MEQAEGHDRDFRKQDDQIRSFILAGNVDAALRISTTTARETTSQIDALLADVFQLERERLAAASKNATDEYTNIRSIVIGWQQSLRSQRSAPPFGSSFPSARVSARR